MNLINLTQSYKVALETPLTPKMVYGNYTATLYP